MNPEKVIKEFCLNLDPADLWVGFSGGADSTALVLALHNCGIPFHAVHFNHHLRPTADRDQDFCEKFCCERDIPFSSISIRLDKEDSIESEARAKRQSEWKNLCSKHVFLAHHRDDILENFILRSMRGSSSSGLSGLRSESIIDKVTYLRPFLKLSKADLLSYLETNDIQWVEDETNRENVYSRNVVRNKILPELSSIGSLDGLFRSTINIETDARFIEKCAANWLNNHDMSAKNFLNADNALKPRILRLFINRQAGTDFIPGHTAIDRLTEELGKQHQETVEIPLGAKVFLKLTPDGKLFLPSEEFNVLWNWRSSPSLNLPGGQQLKAEINKGSGEKFKLCDLSENLTVRTWQPGDRMIPFSFQSPKKVKDLFSDRKTAADMRLALPILIDKETLIWIPEVRRAEFGRCTPGDDFVCFSYEKF